MNRYTVLFMLLCLYSLATKVTEAKKKSTIPLNDGDNEEGLSDSSEEVTVTEDSWQRTKKSLFDGMQNIKPIVSATFGDHKNNSNASSNTSKHNEGDISQPAVPISPSKGNGGVNPPKPAVPTNPSKGNGGLNPPKPAVPTDPSKGNGGVNPPKPAVPTDPSKGNSGVNPPKPAVPTDPSKGNSGVSPPKPAVPTDPSKGNGGVHLPKSAVPTDPSKGNSGVHPPKPAVPTDPSKGNSGVHPPKPAVPTDPSKGNGGSKLLKPIDPADKLPKNYTTSEHHYVKGPTDKSWESKSKEQTKVFRGHYTANLN